MVGFLHHESPAPLVVDVDRYLIVFKRLFVKTIFAAFYSLLQYVSFYFYLFLSIIFKLMKDLFGFVLKIDLREIDENKYSS